jgi:hypothetical protein
MAMESEIVRSATHTAAVSDLEERIVINRDSHARARYEARTNQWFAIESNKKTNSSREQEETVLSAIMASIFDAPMPEGEMPTSPTQSMECGI